jgi:putative restriction endonuclease
MALCGLHHWSFDQGLIGVTPNYQVLVSPIVPGDQETILSIGEQELYLPRDDLLKPAKQALNWHRENIFRAEALTRLIG